MLSMRGLIFSTLVLCGAFSGPAAALEVAGVTLEPTITLAGTPLVLNGAGVRYKAVFKVNVAGIYAVKKFGSLDEFIALPGPKRAELVLLREISSDLMAKSMVRGIEDNYPKSELSKIAPSLIRVSNIFFENKTFATGDKIYIDWIPGTGTVFTVRGKIQGEPFKEPEFLRAIVSVWLGEVPVDAKLKDALLGR